MNWKRVVAVMAFVLPLLGLLAFGMTRDPREMPSVLPGKPAPPFTLQTLQYPGAPPAPATMSLAEQAGKVVVVNYWASWCLACRGEHASLSRVAEQYQQQGAPVQFLGMLYQDTPDNGAAWIDAMGGQSYPTLLDPDSRTAIDYGLYGVPETFFITPDGKVAYKHVGPVTDSLLIAKIEELRLPAVKESTE